MPVTTVLEASITCWPLLPAMGQTGLLAAADLAGLLHRETYQVKNGTRPSVRTWVRGEMDSYYGRRFWAIETLEEQRVVARLLRRRFPQVLEGLSEIFEEVDPLDIVYPGNPNEYSDVVPEIIVLLSPIEGKIGLLPSGQIEALVREALSRCFDDEPVEGKVQELVRKIAAQFKDLYALPQ